MNSLCLIVICLLASALFVQVEGGKKGKSHRSKISPVLQKRCTQSPEKVQNVILTMSKGTQEILDSSTSNEQTKELSREEQISTLASTLSQHSEETQTATCEFLESKGGQEVEPHELHSNSNSNSDSETESESDSDSPSMKYSTIWISNKVVVVHADCSIIQELDEGQPDIESISEDKMYHIEDPPETLISTTVDEVSTDNPEIAWGVSQIRANKVWEDLNNKGEGIRVANIDTGVNGKHVALKDNYLGDEFGWYDPIDGTAAPNDNHGHGTHTMGTIAGKGGIGVAPNVQWMAAKGCNDQGQCPSSALLACMQFMLCPSPPVSNPEDVPDEDGANTNKTRDCSHAPHILSCSLGGPPDPSDDVFHTEMDTLKAAGILSIFSIGNSGPKCGTAGTPGKFDNVIGVGAVGQDRKLASFSSRGDQVRTPTALPKPDITAPGVKIVSASNTNTTGFKTMSGTSMACPHVAGVVALMLVKNPDLTFEECRDIIHRSTVQQEGTDEDWKANVCGEPTDSEVRYPSNSEGFGEIDAWDCVENTPKKEEPVEEPTEEPTEEPVKEEYYKSSEESPPYSY